MKLGEGAGKSMVSYAVMLGILYVIIGSIEFATGLWDLVAPGATEAILGLPTDLFGGFATLVTGAAFFAAIPLWRRKYESLGFVLVAVMLSAVFGVLYLLVLGSNGFGAYLAGELSEWDWMTDVLRPEIWLFFLSTPLGYFALKVARARKG